MLFLGVGFIGVIRSHSAVRTIADRRFAVTRTALISTASRLPDSPRVLFQLAEAEMTETASDMQYLAQAQMHVTRAINLSPWDYRFWQVLATAQDADNKPEAAERSLITAARLAPNYVEVNWALANLMLRQGKLNESLKPFQVAASANSDLLPTAFDLLWQASRGDLELLKSLAGDSAKVQLALTQFLAEQSQAAAAIAIYRGIDAGKKIGSPYAAAFISSLISANQQATARALWLDSIKALMGQTVVDGLIWNGGFETDPLKQFNHFDWTISPSNYARIGFDRNVVHGGGRSLKLIFAGRDTTKLEGEIKQLVALKPGARYRLECYAKAASLVTPEGPRLALLGKDGVLSVSEPVVADSDEWQNLAINFTSPPQAMNTYVAIVRIPRFSYDSPTRGTVWFDDFTLTER